MCFNAVLGLIVSTALGLSASSVSVAAGDPDACMLLSTSEVSAATGVTVEAGQPVANRMCQWTEVGKAAAKAKMVQVTVMGQMGTLSPVDRFNNGKRPVAGINKTPIAGLGDDAYVIETRLMTLNVRKGNTVFQIIASGFADDSQRRAALEKLGRAAAAKL